MIIPNLEQSLLNELNYAKEIYVAVALMKDYGLNIIENNVPETCKRQYLLGVDLPTSPSVLYKLLDKKNSDVNIHTKLYTGTTYHPKVYLIKKVSDEYVAFVGSANATLGGLTRNKEMNFMFTNSAECNELLSWFENLFNEAREFDKDYVKEYEKTYKRNAGYSNAQKSNLNQLLERPMIMPGTAIGVFPTQFFKQSDYDALAPLYYRDDSDAAKSRRDVVRNKLYRLDQQIFPLFEDYGIIDLHQHYRYHLTTSLHYRVRYKTNDLDAIWLHYGKDEPDLGEGGFTDSCRMQVIIRNGTDRSYVGIWLYVGKRGGSRLDRENLKNKLVNDDFTNLLYQYFLELGSSYSIEIGDDSEDATSLIDANSFRNFLLSDDYLSYYIIGREYHPNDSDISEDNIKESVLVEFAKLYKLYKMIITP